MNSFQCQVCSIMRLPASVKCIFISSQARQLLHGDAGSTACIFSSLSLVEGLGLQVLAPQMPPHGEAAGASA